MLGQSPEEARQRALAAMRPGPDRRPRAGLRAATRTSCRAACSSAWSSPWPLHPTRSSSCSTSRRPGSTRRSRRACWTSCGRSVAETNAAVLLIAHNLGVIRSMCDRVGVMYAGKIVEEGGRSRSSSVPSTRTRSACSGLAPPRHPQGPAAADDHPGQPAPDRHAAPDLRVRRPLSARRRTCVARSCRRSSPSGNGQWTRCHHRDRLGELPVPASGGGQAHGRRGGRRASPTCRRRSTVRPRRARPSSGWTWKLFDGETLGLVGESGSGKTTLAKTILGIEGPGRRAAHRNRRQGARRPPSGRSDRTSAPSRWSSRTRIRPSTGVGPCGTS